MSRKGCSVCNSEHAGDVAVEIAEGRSDAVISGQHPSLSASAVSRHRRGCLLQPRREKLPGGVSNRAPRPARVKAGRIGQVTDPDRCDKCGTSSTDISPESILKRVERLLYRAETIAEKADDSENYRLTLLACDRANKSLELLAKASGLISDGVNVNVGIGIRGSDPLAGVSNAELGSMIAKLRREMALESGDVIDAKVISIDSEPLRGPGTALAVPVDTWSRANAPAAFKGPKTASRF